MSCPNNYVLYCMPESQVVLPEYYLLFCPKKINLNISRGGGGGGLQPRSHLSRTPLSKSQYFFFLTIYSEIHVFVFFVCI